MVHKKNERQETIMQMLDRAVGNLGEIVDTRWYVYEYTPGYNTGGYYDQDIPAKSVKVSDFFKKRHEAVAWMDKHEPEDGSQLKIASQNLRRKTIETWGP